MAAGDQEGYGRGKADGLAAGRLEGRAEALQEFTLQHHAERNWEIYDKQVRKMGGWADRLEGDRGNPELEDQLKSEARAVVEAAQALQAAYADQAESFNSIINDMAAALDATNFPRLRGLTRALRNTLETKGELFLQANKRIVTAFGDINELSSQ